MMGKNMWELHTLLDEALIRQWVDSTTALAKLQDDIGRIEMELTHRMEARGATAIDDPDYVVTLKEGSPTWDYGKLAGLREVTSPEQLEGSYFPEHPETRVVPEKWNMTKAKTLGRFGSVHTDILARARITGPRRLKISQNSGMGSVPHGHTNEPAKSEG
jgi:hypothetical protein